MRNISANLSKILALKQTVWYTFDIIPHYYRIVWEGAMIYFDNSATTIQKPRSVSLATQDALELGNPGRSFHAPAMNASRTLLQARQEIAKLTQCPSPLSVAFTSGATESLNLVIASLITPQDHVITTALEHNSVLRPLYRCGCELSILPFDDQGVLCLDQLSGLLRPNTKCLVTTHGSNLLGTLTPVEDLHAFAKNHGLRFILDVSQTLGSVPVSGDMADVLCFTGHKALLGPQGTGGIIATKDCPFALVKTGGSGNNSFAPHQALSFPDIFEAGTPNTPGLAGLGAGVHWLNEQGMGAIVQHEQSLCGNLFRGLETIPNVTVYGQGYIPKTGRLPVIALNIGDYSADEVSMALWERWEIATRPGSHCAPLVHQHFATEQRGMVRLSMGAYNTLDEVDKVLTALYKLEREGL